MSIVKKLISQTAIYGLPTIVGRLINFLLVPLYTAKLSGAAAYGELSTMFAFASFMAVVFTFGMETAFFNFARKSKNPETVFSTAIISVFFVSIVLILLTLLLKKPIMEFIGFPNKEIYAVVFAFILSADALAAIAFSWLRLNEKALQFALVKSVNIGLNVVLNLLFILVFPKIFASSFFGEQNFVLLIFIANLISSVIVIPLLIKTFLHVKSGFNKVLFKKMLKYAWPLIIVGLSGMINETLDRILLKKLLPENIADTEVGIYSAFYKLSLIITIFIQAFRFAAEPLFFKQADDKNAKYTYAKIMKYFVYFVCFIYLFTCLNVKWLTPLLLRNAQYYNELRGYYIVPILLMANIFLGMYYNVSIWYKLSNKTIFGALTSVISAIFTLVINYIFISKYSFIASAWATCISYFVLLFSGYYLGQRFYKIPYNIRKIVIVLVATIVLGYIMQLFLSGSGYIVGIACIMLYACVVWLFERNEIKKLFR